jgi:hypothetical protein
MNQDWYYEQEKRIEDFRVFELHSVIEFVKNTNLLIIVSCYCYIFYQKTIELGTINQIYITYFSSSKKNIL